MLAATYIMHLDSLYPHHHIFLRFSDTWTHTMGTPLRPTIQIINTSKQHNDTDRLPFDISDQDDSLHSKFIQALHYKDLHSSHATGDGTSLFDRTHVQLARQPQLTLSKYEHGKAFAPPSKPSKVERSNGSYESNGSGDDEKG